MRIDFTICDESLNQEEREDILLFCEHAILKTYQEFFETMPQIKLFRFWAGFEAEITGEFIGIYRSPYDFVKLLNQKLIRFHYWNKYDENGDPCLIMDTFPILHEVFEI